MIFLTHNLDVVYQAHDTLYVLKQLELQLRDNNLS